MRLASIFLCLILATGCMRNPVTGSHELVLIEESQEIVIGDEIFGKMQEAEGGVYQNPHVAAYVQKVGSRLAAVSDRPNLPYQFVVLDNDIPNAWTLPGGKIAINKGLLKSLENEAELAAVLSHEIVHAAARHGAKQLEESLLIDIASSVGSESAGQGSEELFKIGGQLISLKYSRNKEFEADRYGILYMAKAGYDTRAAVTLQEKFLRFQEGRRAGWLSGLLATHPPSEERIRANQKSSERHPGGSELGTEPYQEMLSHL